MVLIEPESRSGAEDGEDVDGAEVAAIVEARLSELEKHVEQLEASRTVLEAQLARVRARRLVRFQEAGAARLWAVADTFWPVCSFRARALRALRAQGLDPSREFPRLVFDQAHYMSQCSTAGPTLAHSIRHYLERGEAAGLRPNAFFDPSFYREMGRAAPDRPGCLLLDFLERGLEAGREPSGELADAFGQLLAAGHQPPRALLELIAPMVEQDAEKTPEPLTQATSQS